MSARKPQFEARRNNQVEQFHGALRVDVEDIVDDIEVLDSVLGVQLLDFFENVDGASQPDALPVGETKGAMVRAAAAGQQDSLPPVIICVTKLTLVLVQVDQVVGGERKAVDVRHFGLVFIFHHPIVRPIQKSCD